ncbi:hypothetical protein [Desulforhabdus amnigena]|jgi:hypothetical protein|uniref:Uncharacterized protein n=1 Tax=Desulforhabdus amnigena TaxID=40218 RepID=A0A9W6CUX2_9BACT|nr:hypothetical protein [Desulforhabdus amnigena]NLJ27307.1 hypothetical protein [Deltaproteobacteria bacterium]GLI32954.1 hypothetical protein DAMNIGENAA_03870 [Desulforhabdus amnigena]
MRKSFGAWVSWFVFLIALDFVVPFCVLKDIPKITGSFLFWVVWILVAIVSMFLIFLRWQEDKDENSEGKT